MPEIINLETFRLLRLHLDQDSFKAGAPMPEDSQEMDYDLFINPAHEQRFLLILKLKGIQRGQGKDKNSGLRYDVIGAAEFSVPKIVAEPQKRKTAVVLNGGMILYGLIRGQVALVAGGFPSGALLLPTLEWKQTVERSEKKKSAQQMDIAAENARKPNANHPKTKGTVGGNTLHEKSEMKPKSRSNTRASQRSKA